VSKLTDHPLNRFNSLRQIKHKVRAGDFSRIFTATGSGVSKPLPAMEQKNSRNVPVAGHL